MISQAAFSESTPVTPSQSGDKKSLKIPPLARNQTTPNSINTPPKSTELLTRQLSATQMALSPQLATSPINTIGAYIKHLLGFSTKTTKRSLSEEAECGTPESLAEWLRKGSNPNEIDAYGYTPLVNACLRLIILSFKLSLMFLILKKLKRMY